MEITGRSSRTDLRKYFSKNSIPTENQFADLINGMLNQIDDGLVKLSGDPLSLEAAGDDASLKPLINFYRSFRDPSPAWTLTLNPRSNPSDAGSARAGLNISDGDGKSRLFIDRTTGNVGVGTLTPGAKLDIVVAADDANTKPLLMGKGTSPYLTVMNNGNVGITATLTAGNMALSSNNEQRGALFFAVAGDANHSLYNNYRNRDGEGGWDGMKWNTYRGLNIRVGTKPFTSALYVTGSGVGIGTTGPGAKLAVAVAADDGDTRPLLIGKGPLTYLTILNSGNVGIGATDPLRALQIGANTNAAFTFEPSDASPNAGYIRFGDNTGWKLHFGRSQESGGAQLNTGTTGVLMTLQDNGNIGIGTPNPGALLDVTATNRTGRGSIATYYGGVAEVMRGTYTEFNTQLEVGDTITVGGQTRTIASISNNYTLFVDRPFDPVIGSSQAFTFSSPPALVVTAHKVGIGTLTPGAKLEVMGDIKTNRGFATVANVAGVKIRFGSQDLDVLVNGTRLDTIKHGETFSSPESYFVIAKVCEKHPTVGVALVTTYECRPLNATEFLIRWGHNQNMNISAVVYYVVIGM